MKLKKAVAVQDICNIIKAEHSGHGRELISGINEIHKVSRGDLTFVDFDKYYDKALQSAASVILINKKLPAPDGKVLIFTQDPFDDYNKIVKHFYKKQASAKSMNGAVGSSSIIYPGVYIGHGVKIGENCIVYPNVSIMDYTEIADGVIIQSNTVIGSDAFYYKGNNQKVYTRMESCGKVIIRNNVEIGAACTIDRGVSGETIIGTGTKIDNLVHIGHGTTIGNNCLIAAQTGIAGKVKIGNRVIIWGQVGISKDLEIGDDAVIYAQSGVIKSLDAGKTYFGSPVEEAREKMKQMAILKYLPDWWETIIKKS